MINMFKKIRGKDKKDEKENFIRISESLKRNKWTFQN